MQRAESKHYFRRRAAQERAAAARCGDERAAQSHRQLAELYERQAKGEEQERPHDAPQAVTVLPPEFRILP